MLGRAMRCLLPLWVCLAATGPVRAQPVDETTKKVARDLGQQGVELYQQGDYEQAADRLERAYTIMPVPTLGLWSARALEKAGRLVAASERYVDVMRTQLDAGAEAAFVRAKEDAAQENDALQPRIPKLVVDIEGGAAQSVSATVDGNPLAPALIGVPVPLDPGEHVVVVRGAGGETARQDVVLEEGQTESVEMALASPAANVEPTPSEQGAATPADEPPGSDGGSMRTLGYVSLGVGGAGLVLGGVTGLIALGQRSDLQEICTDDACPSSAEEDVDAYDTSRLLSTIGFAVGVVGAGVGVTLLLVAPDDPEDSPSAALEMRPDQVIVKGRF